MKVLIACGGVKAPHPTSALALYRGSYFRACARWALSVADPARIYVLSARYGIVRGASQLAPYDVRIGDPGSVTVDHLARDVARLGLDGAGLLFCGGARYWHMVRRVLPHALWVTEAMPAHRRGIGSQLAWFKLNAGGLP